MSLLTASYRTNTQCRTTFFPIIFLSCLLFLTMFAYGRAYGSEVTLAWDASSDSAVQGYNLYWRTEGQQYALLGDVGNSAQETVSDLQPGTTYYFVATAYDSARNESEYSNEVKYAAPAPVTTYTLTTSKLGTGTGAIEVNPGGTTFTAGTVVSVKAIPGDSSTFAGWSGTCSGTNSICYLTMNSNINVGATFNTTVPAGDNTIPTSSGTPTGSPGGTDAASPASAYSLTVTTSGNGSGTVATSPGGITFKPGKVVTLTAKPSASSGFVGWSGACSGTNKTCRITMNSNMTVGAEFASYALTVTTSGNGSGTVATRPGGTRFKAGAIVTLTAKPSASSGFVGWSGACSGTNKTCRITMNSNMTVGAEFASYALTVTTSGNGSGTVATRPGGTRFKAGAIVTLTAKPSANSVFMGWSGACSGTNKTCKVMMDADNKTVEGRFALKTFTISASAGVGGIISPSATVSVLAGSSQFFTITPADGYRVDYLTINGRKLKTTATTYTFTNITKNQSIYASFINQ